MRTSTKKFFIHKNKGFIKINELYEVTDNELYESHMSKVEKLAESFNLVYSIPQSYIFIDFKI